jgi:hypothetical protein
VGSGTPGGQCQWSSWGVQAPAALVELGAADGAAKDVAAAVAVAVAVAEALLAEAGEVGAACESSEEGTAV